MLRRPRPAFLFPVLSLALLLAVVAGICWGEAAQISPSQALGIVLHRLELAKAGDWPTNYEFIVLHVRAPRVLVAALVGAGLAVAGCLLQGLFNNPLASPDILGVSSGGALGAVCAIFLGLDVLSPVWLPALAFVGALGASLAVYAIATSHGRTP
ncbi:MAG: iron chelate uptake ABC transporter family permease subunit, partial [Candidatus Sumerlaeota bacterium]|nr:iron chelate uptake ABC transporter family permease subunit [Candidatus Sumerlaeota bacterium]